MLSEVASLASMCLCLTSDEIKSTAVVEMWLFHLQALTLEVASAVAER